MLWLLSSVLLLSCGRVTSALLAFFALAALAAVGATQVGRARWRGLKDRDAFALDFDPGADADVVLDRRSGPACLGCVGEGEGEARGGRSGWRESELRVGPFGGEVFREVRLEDVELLARAPAVAIGIRSLEGQT